MNSMAAQLQPGLFDIAPVNFSRAVENTAPLSAQERFEEFHKRNPRVYLLICEYARRAKARGKKTYSLKTIWCLIRFEEDLRSDGGEYVLNDVFTSRYARLVMAQEPDLVGFFALRELRTK